MSGVSAARAAGAFIDSRSFPPLPRLGLRGLALGCRRWVSLFCAVVFALSAGIASGEGLDPESGVAAEELEPTLYVTATAHLDTQWLWTIQKTIDEFIPNTLNGNFALFEKFPNYRFSFEGSFRYMLVKEYYPAEYARLKEYVAQGRWNVCGSSVDAGDVNIPSPESLMRQILYGNEFFLREFGKISTDIFLPDCFGFGFALPSIAAHCGLKGFSTQKLTWGSSVGIPFDIGVWEGVDGSSFIAALNPGDYVSKLRSDLSTDEEWAKRIEALGKSSGVAVGYKYFGVGDQGGAPDDESVEWLEKSMAGEGPVRVISVPADQLYRDLTEEQIARLPRYKGEMLMTRHGTGCYTSQAAMKRWNRKNELLIDAVERASVMADWLGTIIYPRTRIANTWTRFLWHQFHDDLTGTSIPKAYTFSWNDEIISLNQSAEMLRHAVGGVARLLDTSVTDEGGTPSVPLVVFNPVGADRVDIVEATVEFPGGAPKAVGVFDRSGKEVASQVLRVGDREIDLLFVANVPSVGFAVYEVRAAASPFAASNELRVSESGLENSRYRLKIDSNGDVSSVYDKKLARELLAGPVRLDMFHDNPAYWDEWEIRYEDITAKPYASVGGPVKVEIVERGPVRAMVKIVRNHSGSNFIQRISLGSGGAGDRVVFENVVDSRTPATLLKATFPLTASNEIATYDLGFGVIERPTNTENKYEVPAQQWADITAADSSFGVSILNDCKYGWDKPDDHTLRLSLIHSPKQVQKDFGFHRFTYALVGHRGDWRKGGTMVQAAALNQPLMAFQTEAHAGSSIPQISLVSLSSSQAVIRAVKKAERSEEIIVRVQEAYGRPASDVKMSFAVDILEFKEVNGSEQPLDTQTNGGRTVRLDEGRLVFGLNAFQPRTFALRLARHPSSVPWPRSRSVRLAFDVDVISFDADRSDGDFDGQGHSLPAELVPQLLIVEDVPFQLGPTAPTATNAVSCRGQTIELPVSGHYDRIYLLAAATETVSGTFTVGDSAQDLSIRAFSGWIGQSDSLFYDGSLHYGDNMAPAFIHRDRVAWVSSHRHDAASDRNEPYVFCYLFKYALNVPSSASTVTLPDDPRIRVLAMTMTEDANDKTTSAGDLYDRTSAVWIQPRGGLYIEPATVELKTDESAGEIVYTLDGSAPTATSSRYKDTLRIERTCVLTARRIDHGVLDDVVTRATFTMAELRAPDRVAILSPGLSYKYYEGEWTELPDFDAMEPVQSGITSGFGLSKRTRDQHFGLRFDGFVNVQKDGIYKFYTSSDDGSRLYIGGKLVVDNGGLHGAKQKYGEVALGVGIHGIRVDYFERGGDQELEVQYQGPGFDKRAIPDDALLHRVEK